MKDIDSEGNIIEYPDNDEYPKKQDKSSISRRTLIILATIICLIGIILVSLTAGLIFYISNDPKSFKDFIWLFTPTFFLIVSLFVAFRWQHIGGSLVIIGGFIIMLGLISITFYVLSIIAGMIFISSGLLFFASNKKNETNWTI